QDDDALVGAVEERLQRITPEVRIGGDGVGAEAIERFGRVMLRGAADVAALGVENDRDARMRGVDMRDEPLQRVFRAESREMRDLRLEAADVLRGSVNDRTAEIEDRIGIVGEFR